MTKRFWLIPSRDIYDKIFIEDSHKNVSLVGLECLLCKNKDLSSIPRIHIKLGMLALTCDPSLSKLVTPGPASKKMDPVTKDDSG